MDLSSSLIPPLDFQRPSLRFIAHELIPRWTLSDRGWSKWMDIFKVNLEHLVTIFPLVLTQRCSNVAHRNLLSFPCDFLSFNFDNVSSSLTVEDCFTPWSHGPTGRASAFIWANLKVTRIFSYFHGNLCLVPSRHLLTLNGTNTTWKIISCSREARPPSGKPQALLKDIIYLLHCSSRAAEHGWRKVTYVNRVVLP